MSFSDLHPALSVLLFILCTGFAYFLSVCVPVFWRHDPTQKAFTVGPCRTMAVVIALLAVLFGLAAALHLLAALAPALAAVYGWGVL